MAADEPLEYRPLSAWAIAGLGLALLYAAAVFASAAIGLLRSEPLYLPGWTVLIPISAGVVSMVALHTIRQSEGVQAGQGLAQWGLAISLFVGAGYAAHTYFTGLALVQQAEAFLRAKDDDTAPISDSGFFPRLLAGSSDLKEFHRAYFLTLPAPDRSGNPASERDMALQHDVGSKDGRGKLSQFRNHTLVQMFLQARPDQIQVETQGVQSWKWDQFSYQVARNYRITSPERTMHVVLLVKSTEPAAEGEHRKWFLDLVNSKYIGETPTPLGQNLTILGMNARGFLDAWNVELGRSARFDYPDQVQADWNALIADPERRRLVAEKFKAFSDKPNAAFLINRETQIPAWRQAADGTLEIGISAAMHFDRFSLDGRLWVRTTLPVDPNHPGETPIIWQEPIYQVERVQFFE